MQRRSHSYEPRARASGIFAYERSLPGTGNHDDGWHGQTLKGMAMILYFLIVDSFMAIGLGLC